MIVYDVNSNKSVEGVENWLIFASENSEKTVIVVIGSKIDLLENSIQQKLLSNELDSNSIPKNISEVNEFCIQKNLVHFFCSGKTNLNTQQILINLVKLKLNFDLNVNWKKETHRFFSLETRKIVFTLILIHYRLKIKNKSDFPSNPNFNSKSNFGLFPKPILFEIISLMIYFQQNGIDFIQQFPQEKKSSFCPIF